MKRYTLWTLITALAIFVSLCLLPACNSSDKQDDSISPTDLIAHLKKSLEPMGISLDPGDVSITDDSPSPTNANTRKLYTFNNPKFSVSHKPKKNNKPSGFVPNITSVNMKELTLRFGAKEKFLQIVSAKGLEVNFSVPSLETDDEKTGKAEGFKLNVSTGEVAFEDYNIDEVLTMNSNNPKEFFLLLMGKKVKATSRSKDVQYRLNVPYGKNANLEVDIQLANLVSSQGLNREVFGAVYGFKKDSELPDFECLLEEGLPLFDILLKGEDFKFTVKMNGIPMGNGAIKDFQLSYFLKPDQKKRYYQYGFDWNLSGIDTQIPLLQALSPLTQLKAIGLDIKVIKLSPAFMKVYFQMLKKTTELETTASAEEIRKHEMALKTKIFMEATRSHPKIEFSISPFSHALGDLELQGYFSFSGIGFPVGKAWVRVKDLDTLLTNLKQENVLPASIGALVLNYLEQYVIKNEDGSGSITLETKEEYPGQLFLNDKLLKLK